MSFCVKENEPLAPYCSMKVGGKAKHTVFPDGPDGLAEALRKYRFGGERCIVVGNCSNLVFPDEGFDGAVIITSGINGVKADGSVINAECGATLTSLARNAAKYSLAGFEFCFGIPGTVGGGVYMNAGAYGGDITQRITGCTVLDRNLDRAELPPEALELGYRTSSVEKNGYTVLSATFSGVPGDRDAIGAKMDELMAKRKSSQPLEYPSCGSAFKRPEGHYAGALIEQCGLKGVSVGGAQVSEKHAGFIINKGGATANDVKDLVELIQKTVLENTGVKLEPEIRFIDTEI